MSTQDRELSLAMRTILAIAKRMLPDSIIVVMSFTDAEDDPGITIEKIAVNTETREVLCEHGIRLLKNFAAAGVIDLTDTQGGVH